MIDFMILSLIFEAFHNQRMEGGFNQFDSSFPKIFKVSDFHSNNQQIVYQYANITIDISKFDEDDQIVFKKIEQKYQ